MISRHLRKIAADSNVLLSAVIGKAALKIFTQSDITVVTTRFNIEEVREYLPHLSERYKIPKTYLLLQLSMLPIIEYEESYYESRMREARKYLGHRDVDDAHLAALALKEGIPVWSNDKDFEKFPGGGQGC